MWLRFILTAAALAVVLYLQLCFDPKDFIGEVEDKIALDGSSR